MEVQHASAGREPAPVPDERQGVRKRDRDAAPALQRIGPHHGQIPDAATLDVDLRPTPERAGPDVRRRPNALHHEVLGRELREPADEALDSPDLRAAEIGGVEDERPGPRLRHTGSSAVARARYVATRARTAPNVPMAR